MHSAAASAPPAHRCTLGCLVIGGRAADLGPLRGDLSSLGSLLRETTLSRCVSGGDRKYKHPSRFVRPP
jgi:hypothetical protein